MSVTVSTSASAEPGEVSETGRRRWVALVVLCLAERRLITAMNPCPFGVWVRTATFRAWAPFGYRFAHRVSTQGGPRHLRLGQLHPVVSIPFPGRSRGTQWLRFR